MPVMSNVDSWFGKNKMDDESDGNLKGNSNGGNMDAELASIVSSLSALSNATNNNGNNGSSDRRGSAQLGGFRRSSLGYTSTGPTASSPAGTSTNHNTNACVGGASGSGEQELLMYSTMGGGGVPEEATSSQSSSPIIARRAALSVGTAPPYNPSYRPHRLHQDESLSGQPFFSNNRLNFMGHYSASIAGPILFNHNDGNNGSDGGFFERFGKSLIEGTRELEDESNSATDISTVTQMNTNGESLTDNQNHMLASLQNARRASVTSNSTASEPIDQLADASNKAKRNIWNVAAAPIFKPDASVADQYLILPQQQQQQQQASSNPPTFPGPFPPQFLPPAISPTPMPPTALSSAGTPPLDASFLQTPYLYLANDLYPGIPPPAPQSGVTSIHDQQSNNAPLHLPNSSISSTQRNRTPVSVPPGKRNVSGKNSSRKHQGVNPYLDNTNNAPASMHTNRNASASPHASRDRNNNNSNHNNNSNNSNHNSNSNNNSSGGKKKHVASNKTNPVISTNAKSKGNTSNGKWSNYYAIRSPVLEEFRSNLTSKTYELKDIVGYVLEFCQDQHGSRFIQYELAAASSSEREIIFNEIRDRTIELSDDVFGNYVIQKFFEFGSKTQKNILINKFKGKMQELSMQMYACRVVQRALEFIELDQRIELVNELSSCVLEMIKDQNGNHVIQKAIESIPMTELPFILDSLDGEIYNLSTHAYGCRVIQRLLEFGSESDQSRIFNEIKDFIPYLIQDQYGNYVIQHVLQQDDNNCLKDMAKTKQDIVDIVSQTVVEFSKHKFASNVVEKAILHGTDSQRELIMSKVIPTDEASAIQLGENSPMVLMMRDQFANYVVQKLVGVSEGRNKRLIVIAIKSYLEKLNTSDSVGSRNLASVEKLASLVETVTI